MLLHLYFHKLQTCLKSKIKYNTMRLILKTILIFCITAACCINPAFSKQNLSQKVKDEFVYVWNNYKKYAWGYDDLKPISKSGSNWYNKTVCMTAVDAYDAMLLMGLEKEAKEAKKLIKDSLNFEIDDYVSNFEMTIRILGGLLSAYQLDNDVYFLRMAEDLGQRLLPAFNSPTGLPYRYVNLKTGDTRDAINVTSEIGTLVLEYGTLSKFSGNPVYFNVAKNALIGLNSRKDPNTGLPGLLIDIETGEWVFKESSISGGIDSYYEYLIKGAMLFKDQELLKIYDESKKNIEKYLCDTVDNRIWYGAANMQTGTRTRTEFGAIDAYYIPVLLLGGDTVKAQNLMKSCFYMWDYYSMSPEKFNYMTNELLIKSSELRPELFESAYFLWQSTQDSSLITRCEDMLNTIIIKCKVLGGYAPIADLLGNKKIDLLNSYFLSETLKYAFLILNDEPTFDLENVIFSTQGHLFFKD